MTVELSEKVKIALVVTAYFVISISMVLMNKFLLSQKESIPAPFFVTWCPLHISINFQVSMCHYRIYLLASRKVGQEYERV